MGGEFWGEAGVSHELPNSWHALCEGSGAVVGRVVLDTLTEVVEFAEEGLSHIRPCGSIS